MVPTHPGSPGQRVIKWCVCCWQLNFSVTYKPRYQYCILRKQSIQQWHKTNPTDTLLETKIINVNFLRKVGADMASAECEPITGPGVSAPSGIQWQRPRSGGKVPHDAEGIVFQKCKWGEICHVTCWNIFFERILWHFCFGIILLVVTLTKSVSLGA